MFMVFLTIEGGLDHVYHYRYTYYNSYVTSFLQCVVT